MPGFAAREQSVERPPSKRQPERSPTLTHPTPLFRREALQGQGAQWLGSIILVRPLSFTLLTALASALALVVVGFFIWGSYTKRSTVVGQLVPVSGQAKIYAPQMGVITERPVHEGQKVERGQTLLSLSSERYGNQQQPVQAGISQQLQDSRQSLEEQLRKLQRLQDDERRSLTAKVASLRTELATQGAQLQSQGKLVAIASDAEGRYQGLMDKGYISMDQFQQRQGELLGQRQTLQRLERERMTLQQELRERDSDLAGLDARHANQQAEVRRQLYSVQQQLAESEAKRTLRIVAPQDGIATAVFAEIGQSVDPSRPLLSIVPENAQLVAELYAPSRAVGFIKVGDPALIRYQAYPYQKFGQYHGKVLSISRTTVPFNELASMAGAVPGIGQSGEQYYRIRVQLAEQQIQAYGQPRSLQSGMLLEADLLQETRKLYEWVLEPLYSLTGKL